MEESKKLNEVLIRIYDSLTDEQKEKTKQCRTMDELIELAHTEGVELPEGVLDKIAGGYPFFRSFDKKPPESGQPGGKKAGCTSD